MRNQPRTVLGQKHSQGFTLIELMVVLAILAVVAAIAVPNYQSSIAASRKTSAANQLLGALQFARSEAVLSRKEIRVCASSNGTSCAGSDWGQGAIVLRTDTSKVLRKIPAVKDVAISGASITFKADGTTTASSLVVGSSPSKNISVSIVGMAKIN